MKLLVVLFITNLIYSCQPSESVNTSGSLNQVLKAIIDEYSKSNKDCIHSDSLFYCEFIKKPLALISKDGRRVKILPGINENRIYSIISSYSFENDTAKITLIKKSCGTTSHFRLLKSGSGKWIFLQAQESDI